MKTKIIISLLLFVVLSANCQVQSIKLYPENPTKRDSIVLTFDPSNSILSESNHIICVVYLNDLQNHIISNVIEVSMEKNRHEWTCKIPINDKSVSFLFAFTDTLGNKENNGGVGFWKTIYEKNKPLPLGLGSIANLYASGWKTTFPFEQNNSLAKRLFVEEFTNHPLLKREFLFSYLSTLSGGEKEKEIIKKELINFKKEQNISSTEFFLMSRYYRKIGDIDGINSSIDSLILKFPETAMAIEYSSLELRKKIWNEQSFEKQIELFNEYKMKYTNSSNEEGQNRINSHIADFLRILSVSYINSNKFNEWEKLIVDLDSSTLSDVLHRSSMEILSKKFNLQIAEKLAKQAIQIKKKNIFLPRIRWKESNVLTEKQVLAFREEWLSDYIDNYGKILYEQNKKEDALIAYKEAVFYGKKNKTEHNEHYIQTLFELKKYSDAISEINYLMKIGKSTPTIKTILDNLSKTPESTKKVTEQYLDNSLLISEKLPNNVVLKDVDNKDVYLTDFKGKTIIIDFWASWCNACIKGFPMMYNLSEKYRNKENIVFLFINTLEKKNLSKSEINNILLREKYDFTLLFDNENKNSKQLQIKGLPTKLIIDKNGVIRYRELGNIDNRENADKFSKLIEMVCK